jgi:hypothetical protein
MAVPISPIEGINLFMPIFSFLFVFILVFALLRKTNILGDNPWLNIFISFLMAIFFVVNASLVEFVKLNSAWFAVFLVSVFFILLLVSFTHGKIDFLQKGWVGWILIGLLIVFFIISSSYVFNWALSFDYLSRVLDTRWVGFILLLIIAGIVSAILVKVKK